jgi:tRNA pseudouridine55 synthase
LRREQVGPFNADQMSTLEELQALAQDGFDALDSLLLPIEKGLMHCPEVNLSRDAAFYIQQGQAVFVPKMKARGFVRLYAGENEFLGVGHILDDGRVAPKRLMNIGKMG